MPTRDRRQAPQADPQGPVGGRYELRGEVGRGGMASVHRAWDEVLERAVAVKLLHAHLADDPAFLARFRREAQAAAALSHPNVVAVHDWGETDAGPFLVLQLVEGPTLRQVLRSRGRLEPGEVVSVLAPAAEGLGAAHAAGLVHRDVKPENLLLGRDETVRVTDFGLARAAASATSTFGADVLVGSPHYLSPEAVRGMPLDARADVYALGVVLYECLTGRPPHEADSPFATAVAHTSQPVPPPSSLRPELDPALDDVVLRATAMQRDDRYDDGRAFAAALRAAVTDDPVPIGAHDGFAPTTGDEDAVQPTGTSVLDDDDPGGTVVVEPEEHETDDVAPRRRRHWLVPLVLLALLLGSAAGGYLLWDRVLAPVTPIPGVVGAEAAAATAQLENAGFVVEVEEETPYDLSVPEDHVLEQSPEGEARAGTAVSLVLSAGPRPVEVADVVGEVEDDAVSRLRDDGLEPSVVREHHETVPEGAVIATDPDATTVVDEASTVEVLVSRGPTPIEVPALASAGIETARDQVEELGLELEVVERRHHPDAPQDTVLSQSPAGGEVLHRGDTVEVVVSDGPEPVEVPNLRGKLVEEAITEVEDRGLVVAVERRGGFGAFLNPGRVYDQDPAPGATRRPGDTVLLYAYEG